jgi:Histidine kinase-, DNA gyrase B-, and HSP90-like ATPase
MGLRNASVVIVGRRFRLPTPWPRWGRRKHHWLWPFLVAPSRLATGMKLSGGSSNAFDLLDRSGDLGEPERSLHVHISYEIIQLFSEGLYKSPHKAIEELVSNSYDAGANQVHVLTPDPDVQDAPLWVIDDGFGMDEAGFVDLWSIAHSRKADDNAPMHRDRPPIGQFGIGKLAAYVLASRLTHISKTESGYRVTSMDFRKVTEHPLGTERPFEVSLRKLTEAEAQLLLGDIEERDAVAWAMLFGPGPRPTWTVAALSQFKDLASRLKGGILGWVLRTGMPPVTDFQIHLNGTPLRSPRSDWVPLARFVVGGDPSARALDHEAQALSVAVVDGGIDIPGIGRITGEAAIYDRPLASSKSDQYHRSHGFFIRVRGRIINIEDELFGLPALNHAAWSRFVMSVDADGLRGELLSSREGVRDVAAVRLLRSYMHEKFNACRRIFESTDERTLQDLDVNRLIAAAPSHLIVEPLVEAVRKEAMDSERTLYYIQVPESLDEEAATAFVNQFAHGVQEAPFAVTRPTAAGPYAPVVQYRASDRHMLLNQDHPFAVKLLAHSKNRVPSMLFGSAEVLTDALLRSLELDPVKVVEFSRQRDRILRLLAGEYPLDAIDVLRLLRVADQDPTAMERAVVAAFRVLGFEAIAKGGSRGGTDGVIDARLGRQRGTRADYRAVFDAKTTDLRRVPASKVSFTALQRFKKAERADYAFILAKAFEGEDDPDSALNQGATDEKVGATILRTEQLARLVQLHIRYGLTLSRIRSLFKCRMIGDGAAWLDALELELTSPEERIPLRLLLVGIHDLKTDSKAEPTVSAVRQTVPQLKAFEPERLEAALGALAVVVGQQWVEVGPGGVVYLHQRPDLILAEADRVLSEEFGKAVSGD